MHEFCLFNTYHASETKDFKLNKNYLKLKRKMKCEINKKKIIAELCK